MGKQRKISMCYTRKKNVNYRKQNMGGKEEWGESQMINLGIGWIQFVFFDEIKVSLDKIS